MGYIGSFTTEKDAFISALMNNVNQKNYKFICAKTVLDLCETMPFALVEDKQTGKRSLIYVRLILQNGEWLYNFMTHSSGPILLTKTLVPIIIWKAFIKNPENMDGELVKKFVKRVIQNQPELKGVSK